jgi:sulfur carrier protein
MRKIKKIKIRANGKIKSIPGNYSLLDLIKVMKIPIKKVAIELNQEIVDKKNIKKINLKDNDKIEIVHFIGGG